MSLRSAELGSINAKLREQEGQFLIRDPFGANPQSYCAGIKEPAATPGISQRQISKIERGKLGPAAEILDRLVERFGKSADTILTGKIQQDLHAGRSEEFGEPATCRQLFRTSVPAGWLSHGTENRWRAVPGSIARFAVGRGIRASRELRWLRRNSPSVSASRRATYHW